MTARRCDEFPASYWFRVSYPGERGFFEASALAPRESEKTMPICAQYLRDGHKWIWNPLRKGSRRKTSCCLSTRLSRDSSVVDRRYSQDARDGTDSRCLRRCSRKYSSGLCDRTVPDEFGIGDFRLPGWHFKAARMCFEPGRKSGLLLRKLSCFRSRFSRADFT
jgi:hypothetical protein